MSRSLLESDDIGRCEWHGIVFGGITTLTATWVRCKEFGSVREDCRSFDDDGLVLCDEHYATYPDKAVS